MDIKEFKNNIENNTISNNPIILKYEDTDFIPYQYLKTIANKKGKEIIYIDSLSDFNFQNDVLFEENKNYLFVYVVEKLMDDILPTYKDLIVICKDIKINLSTDYIEIPKLKNWQIEDFIKLRLPGLNEAEVSWLCNVSKYNIYRLDKECNKIELFNEGMQKIIFQELNNSGGYSDLSSSTIFDFTSAIIKKDLLKINELLNELSSIDVEAIGLVTILTKNIKNIIDIQMNPKSTPESLNLSQKQFSAIKYNVGKFTDFQLIEMFNFLTKIDYKLKSGYLTFSNNTYENNKKFIYYILNNILGIGMKK